jgi:hypothetical protein
MDPVSAVLMAIQIAKAIHGQLEQLKANRKDCIDLAGRVSALLGAIEACKENEIWVKTNSALLDRLVTDLKEAQEFISTLETAFQSTTDKKFTKKQRIGQAKAFFGATEDAVVIQRLNERISQHVNDLSIGSSAAILKQTTAGTTAILQQTTAGFGEVNTKLDRMDALLGALQSMLIAGQVGSAMGNSNMNMNGMNNMVPQQPSQPPSGTSNSNVGTTVVGSSDSSYTTIGIGTSLPSQSMTNGSSTDSKPTGTNATGSPKIGRALEVAAHQFVFGSFMAGLACVYPGAGYRTSVLLLSPLIPAGFMALVYVAVSFQAYKKLRANWLKTIQYQHDQGLPIDSTGGPQLSTMLGTVAAQLLIPLQLYSTPTLGGLAALAGAAYFNSSSDGTITNVSDYHVALVGVGVGTIIFALSYLANAR